MTHKTEFTEFGWKVTTFNHFVPKSLALNFVTRAGWLDFTAKNIKSETADNSGRFRCQCCSIKWEDCQGEYTHLVTFHKKPNVVICDDCAKILMEQGVKWFNRKPKTESSTGSQ